MSRVDFHDPATIAFLSDALQAAGLDGIEIEQPGRSIRIVVDVSSASEARVKSSAAASGSTSSQTVTAPLAGIFTQRPASQDVMAGEVLGFVGVGPVLVPVKATRNGILRRIIVEDGSVVGFGDPLFEIEIRS
jgi:biotin carboxyl carrier protein